MDLTGNSVIDLPYVISDKEHYSLIVFQGSQEHTNKSILIDILD